MRNDDERNLTGCSRWHAGDRSDASQTAEQLGEYRALDRALQALRAMSASLRNEPPYVVLPVRVPWLQRLATGAAWCTAGAGLTLAQGAVVPRFVSGGDEPNLDLTDLRAQFSHVCRITRSSVATGRSLRV